jgi:hypothetical protein
MILIPTVFSVLMAKAITHRLLTQIPLNKLVRCLGGGPEFAVSDGKGKIYNNLEDKNSLNVIDVKALKVIKNYPLAPCGGPTGIALDAEKWPCI